VTVEGRTLVAGEGRLELRSDGAFAEAGGDPLCVLTTLARHLGCVFVGGPEGSAPDRVVTAAGEWSLPRSPDRTPILPEPVAGPPVALSTILRGLRAAETGAVREALTALRRPAGLTALRALVSDSSLRPPARDPHGLRPAVRLAVSLLAGQARGSLRRLTSLDLSHCGLEALPKEIGLATALEELRLSGNALTSLPVEVASLRRLRTLDLSDNALSAVPDAALSLPELEHLHLTGNALIELPMEIARLTTLRVLRVGRNALTSLPDALGGLSRLEVLAAEENRLTALPATISQATVLRELLLDANGLSVFPMVAARLSGLERLSLADNRLATIPLLGLARVLVEDGARLGRLTPTAHALASAALEDGRLPEEVGLEWVAELTVWGNPLPQRSIDGLRLLLPAADIED